MTYFYKREGRLFIKSKRESEKGLLLSPDFTCGVKEQDCRGETLIVLCTLYADGSQKHSVSLMHKKYVEKPLEVFYSPDSQYVGMKTVDRIYKIFRVEDGQLLCSLKCQDTELIFSRSEGGFKTAVGLIDICS